MLTLPLVAGPQKTVTLNSANSLIYLESKNEEKLKIKYLFWHCTDKKQFCPFLENKKSFKQFFSSNFLYADCSLRYKEGFCKFSKKILVFKVPAFFWKWILCRDCDARARGRNCRFFGIEFLKIYLISDQQQRVGFQNRNHSTLQNSSRA